MSGLPLVARQTNHQKHALKTDDAHFSWPSGEPTASEVIDRQPEISVGAALHGTGECLGPRKRERCRDLRTWRPRIRF